MNPLNLAPTKNNLLNCGALCVYREREIPLYGNKKEIFNFQTADHFNNGLPPFIRYLYPDSRIFQFRYRQPGT